MRVFVDSKESVNEEQTQPDTWLERNLIRVRQGANRSIEGRQIPTRFLLVAVWFGLLAAFGELIVLAIKVFYLGQVMHLSRHVIWMVVVVDVLAFFILKLILQMLARAWPRLVSIRIIIFVFAFLALLLPLKIIASLHLFAAFALAAGLALKFSGYVATYRSRFESFVKQTVVWITAGVAVATIAVFAWQEVGRLKVLASLPPPPPSSPNVILIVLDTVRAASLGLYGHERPTTPQLERFAKTGVLFERALATASWTLPSHASMFTGRWPHEMSADWSRPLDATFPTLAEVLAAKGYTTAGFVANLDYCTYEVGLDRGFAHYEDYVISPGQVFLSSSVGREIDANERIRHFLGYHDQFNRKPAADINKSFLRWLARQHGRPFFAFLNYYDAHAPYLPPEPFDLNFGSKMPRKYFRDELHFQQNLSEQDIRAEVNAYEGAVAYLDNQLGLLFEELERQGVIQNTVIIITADHGEEFGEHRIFGHGNSLYWMSLQVPLLVSFPTRVPGDKRISEAVSLRDIPATVLDLVDLHSETVLPGSSLARHWNGTTGFSNMEDVLVLSEINYAPNHPDQCPISKGNMKSLVNERYHYIRNGDGSEELYDLAKDPYERLDLAGSVAAERVLSGFRVSLSTILSNSSRPTVAGPESNLAPRSGQKTATGVEGSSLSAPTRSFQ